MTPVKQTKLYAADGIHNGNCFSACLASLFDLPLWMVPPFDDMFGRVDWRGRVDEYLRKVHAVRMVRTAEHRQPEADECYICCGPSARGVHHSVLYQRGAMIHDPHFSDAGLLEVEWTWHMEPEER